MRNLLTSCFLAILLVLLSGLPAAAQTDTETNSALRFNFALPGARSLAMGGAFLGLADDATAAFTNPAGLTNIITPEVSAEGRYSDTNHVFPLRGRLGGEPTGLGLDSFDGRQLSDSTNVARGLGFVSAVYPTERFAVAVYRHELARSAVDFATQGGFIESGGTLFRVLPYTASNEFRIFSYGISGAVKLWEDVGRGTSVSVGAGVVLHDLSLESTNVRFLFDDFFEPIVFDEAEQFWTHTEHGGDEAVAVNAGIQFQVSPQWSFGAVYRQGPDFEYSTSLSWWDPQIAAILDVEDFPVTFKVPHVYGAGIAFTPSDRWRFLLDYNRVEYSRLVDDFRSVFNAPVFQDLFGQPLVDVSGFQVDDANQVHLGAEYAFLGLRNPVFVRAGLWNDPDSRIRFDGDAAVREAGEDGALTTEDFLWLEGEDRIHYTFGAGISLPTLEINGAADLAEDVTTLSLSFVYRF